MSVKELKEELHLSGADTLNVFFASNSAREELAGAATWPWAKEALTHQGKWNYIKLLCILYKCDFFFTSLLYFTLLPVYTISQFPLSLLTFVITFYLLLSCFSLCLFFAFFSSLHLLPGPPHPLLSSLALCKRDGLSNWSWQTFSHHIAFYLFQSLGPFPLEKANQPNNNQTNKW